MYELEKITLKPPQEKKKKKPTLKEIFVNYNGGAKQNKLKQPKKR